MPFKSKMKSKKSKDVKQDKAIKKLQNLIKPEWKNHVARFEGAASNIPIQPTNANAMVADHITAIAQGTAANQRIGNTIFVRRIAIRGSCLNPGELTNQFQFVRIMIVQDNRYNGTAPAGAEILNNYSVTDVDMMNAYSQPNYTYIAHKDFNRGGRIRILYDKTIYLTSDSATVHTSSPDTAYAYSNTHPQYGFSKVLNFKKPLVVTYEGSNYESGQIFVCTFPGSDTTNTDDPYLSWMTHVMYTDS